MKLKLDNAYLSGEIKAIPSKSYAHRIAICNFLAGKNPTAECGDFSSNDIAVTEKCLKDLMDGKEDLDCGESGSTLRFMIPLCASLGGNYSLFGHGKLMQRPNDQLFSVISENGVNVEQTDKIYLSGKLSAGKYAIRGDVSSQYVSGLLMALPTLNGDSEIVLTTPLVSAPYVEITLEVLRSFGVIIEKTKDGYFIKGNQKYSGRVMPEGDWSNQAFFLCAGAINGNVTVTGLNENSVQGDKYILDILSLAGANVEVTKGTVKVKKSSLKPFTFDAQDCPDLVPISAVLACYADGKSVIKNIQRLKIKESDRVESTIAMLSAFGVKATCDGENLTVYGKKIKGGEVDSFNDHRIVMSTAVLALGANGSSFINGAQAVNKSYPTFFIDYNGIGGKASEV